MRSFELPTKVELNIIWNFRYDGNYADLTVDDVAQLHFNHESVYDTISVYDNHHTMNSIWDTNNILSVENVHGGFFTFQSICENDCDRLIYAPGERDYMIITPDDVDGPHGCVLSNPELIIKLVSWFDPEGARKYQEGEEPSTDMPDIF